MSSRYTCYSGINNFLKRLRWRWSMLMSTLFRLLTDRIHLQISTNTADYNWFKIVSFYLSIQQDNSLFTTTAPTRQAGWTNGNRKLDIFGNSRSRWPSFWANDCPIPKTIYPLSSLISHPYLILLLERLFFLVSILEPHFPSHNKKFFQFQLWSPGVIIICSFFHATCIKPSMLRLVF